MREPPNRDTSIVELSPSEKATTEMTAVSSVVVNAAPPLTSPTTSSTDSVQE
jgi:hypothetical protein